MPGENVGEARQERVRQERVVSQPRIESSSHPAETDTSCSIGGTKERRKVREEILAARAMRGRMRRKMLERKMLEREEEKREKC